MCGQSRIHFLQQLLLVEGEIQIPRSVAQRFVQNSVAQQCIFRDRHATKVPDHVIRKNIANQVETSLPAVNAPVRGGNEGRVGDVERGVRGVAVEARLGHGREAAVPADDVEEGALGADALHKGGEPTDGMGVGRAVGGVLEGDDAHDEKVLAVDVELAVDDGDGFGQRVVMALGPHVDPMAVDRHDRQHGAGTPTGSIGEDHHLPLAVRHAELVPEPGAGRVDVLLEEGGVAVERIPMDPLRFQPFLLAAEGGAKPVELLLRTELLFQPHHALDHRPVFRADPAVAVDAVHQLVLEAAAGVVPSPTCELVHQNGRSANPSPTAYSRNP